MLGICEATFGLEHYYVGVTLQSFVSFYMEIEDWKNALDLSDRSYEILLSYYKDEDNLFVKNALKKRELVQHLSEAKELHNQFIQSPTNLLISLISNSQKLSSTMEFLIKLNNLVNTSECKFDSKPLDNISIDNFVNSSLASNGIDEVVSLIVNEIIGDDEKIVIQQQAIFEPEMNTVSNPILSDIKQDDDSGNESHDLPNVKDLTELAEKLNTCGDDYEKFQSCRSEYFDFNLEISMSIENNSLFYQSSRKVILSKSVIFNGFEISKETLKIPEVVEYLKNLGIKVYLKHDMVILGGEFIICYEDCEKLKSFVPVTERSANSTSFNLLERFNIFNKKLNDNNRSNGPNSSASSVKSNIFEMLNTIHKFTNNNISNSSSSSNSPTNSNSSNNSDSSLNDLQKFSTQSNNTLSEMSSPKRTITTKLDRNLSADNSQSMINSLIKKYNLPNNSQESLEKCLRMAVHNNMIDDVKMLIKLVKNINAKDKNPIQGNTALHLAVFKNNIEIIKLLIENRASVTIQNAQQKSPIDYALDSKELYTLLAPYLPTWSPSPHFFELFLLNKEFTQMHRNPLLVDERNAPIIFGEYYVDRLMDDNLRIFNTNYRIK